MPQGSFLWLIHRTSCCLLLLKDVTASFNRCLTLPQGFAVGDINKTWARGPFISAKMWRIAASKESDSTVLKGKVWITWSVLTFVPEDSSTSEFHLPVKVIDCHCSGSNIRARKQIWHFPGAARTWSWMSSIQLIFSYPYLSLSRSSFLPVVSSTKPIFVKSILMSQFLSITCKSVV